MVSNLVLYREGEPSFVRYIKKRILSNLNFLSLARGPTGIGKSWSLISISYMIDPEFEVRQIAFSFREVMKIINADWFKKKKWKIIIFDEAQTDISNRQWQSLTNKLMNFLLSTFRHQNIILFFSSPYEDFLDSQSRKLLHCIFDIRGHSRKTNTTYVRPKLQQYNSKLQKYYEHSLYVMRDKQTNKLQRWEVPKPPKHLIDPYEKAKTDFTDELNERIMKELEDMGKLDGRKPLTEKQELVMKTMAVLSYKEAMEELDMAKTTLYAHKEASIRKGYTLKEFKKDDDE